MRGKMSVGDIPPAKGVEFDAPEELDLKGDKGTATVQWRRKPDGKVCITAMNGVTLPGDYGPPSSEDEEPDSDESGGPSGSDMDNQ